MKTCQPIRCTEKQFIEMKEQLDAQHQEAQAYLMQRAREIEAARKKKFDDN